MKHHSPQNRGVVTLETIAVIVVMVLVVVVVLAIILVPSGADKSAIKAPVDSLPQNQTAVAEDRQDIQFIDQAGPFAKDPTGKPVNEKFFDENKVTFASFEHKVQQTRFAGKILSIDRSNGLTMQMSSLLGNSLGAEVVYHFEPAVLSKVVVKNGSLDSLAVGQEVNIDETNDYSKAYQDSIQAVEISTI